MKVRNINFMDMSERVKITQNFQKPMIKKKLTALMFQKRNCKISLIP